MSPTLWDSAIGALSCVGSVRSDWTRQAPPNDTDEVDFTLDGESVDALEAIGAWAEVLSAVANSGN